MQRTAKFYAAMAMLGLVPGVMSTADAADFDWNKTSGNDWSLAANWNTGSSGIPDAAGTFVLINTNISTNNTIDLYESLQPGDFTKTVGRLDIGDLTGANNPFTIATGTGAGVLNFDNTGNGRGETNAQLNMLVNSRGDIISAPVTLSTSLDITNASPTFGLTISGGITAVSGAQTINASTGLVTLSGIIANGGGTTSIVQNGAGTLTLAGANTFNGGVTIKDGTVVAGNNAAALGTGTVIIGNNTGSANATLASNANQTYTNAITVQAGSSGTLSLGQTQGEVAFTGGVTLNNHLTLFVNSGGNNGVANVGAYLTVTNVSGSGDLRLAVAGNQATTNSAAPGGLQTNMIVNGTISTTGAISNIGTGTGYANISGNITSASSVSQNSATSMLGLNGTNTYTGNTNVNAGVLRIGTANALPANNVVNVASGGTLQLSIGNATVFGSTATINLAGDGTYYTASAMETTNSANFGGSVVLTTDATVSSNFSAGTLNLSGTVTGSGRTLTVTGVGLSSIASLNTGNGGLIKTGTGTLTLAGANSFTGTTDLRNGTVSLGHASSLDGGGQINFNGGVLRHSSLNTLDLASRIVDSAGPIAINTNGETVSYTSGLAASNTGGLVKLGTGTLTLGGTNGFTGPVAINAGTLRVASSPAGSILVDSGGALQQGDAFTGVQNWLTSGKILASSTGAISLNGPSSETITFSGYDSLMLGASTSSTYTGTLTPAGTTYRLGGGGATLTLSGTNALAGSNGLVIGAVSGTSSSTGNVVISGANNLSGNTTVNAGTLTISGATGSLSSSDISVNTGAALVITAKTATGVVARTGDLTLSRSTATLTGNNTANTTDQITGALVAAAGGHSTVTLTPGNKNAILQIDSFTRNAGATLMMRGTALGVNDLTAGAATSTNLQVTGTAPAGLGGGGGVGTTTRSIFAGVLGDTVNNSSSAGFNATSGLVTYDPAKGFRLLSVAGNEYKDSIGDGQTQLDNVRLARTTAGTSTTTVNSDTTINSLSLVTSTAAGAIVAVNGTGKITLNSGVFYASILSPATDDLSVSNSLDFSGREGILHFGTGSDEVALSGVLSNTANNGITAYGSGDIRLSGTAANTYTGVFTVNGGEVILAKTDGLNTITGDLVINPGGIVSYGVVNQIADAANVTVNGGTFSMASDTFASLTMTRGGGTTYSAGSGATVNISGNALISGGSELISNVSGQVLVGGSLTLTDGGTVTIRRSNPVNGTLTGYTSVAGGLNITHVASGAYTPVQIDFGSGAAQRGGTLLLKSDLTFTGNTTNAFTATIDAPAGHGQRGLVAIDGNRTFNIGNGAAAVDLTVNAGIADGSVIDGGIAGSLTKTGQGTLLLTTASTYSGGTTVSTGKVIVVESASLGTGNVTVGGAGILELDGYLAIDDSRTLIINTGGKVILDFTTLLGETENVGKLVLNGTTFTTGVFDEDSHSAFFQGSGTLTVVPEPGSLAAVVLGAGMLLRRRRARS
jgi:autotransporter-associated beta strand protein